MASVCRPEPEFCSYCGAAPCVGDRCPQWDDDDYGACSFCGRSLSFTDPDDLCRDCGGPDHDDDHDDDLDPRDYEADQ